jgi:hypothetical protein
MSALDWPAVPTPGRIVRLPLGCPAQLVELSGYDGAGRLVAMWWTAIGDELMFSDGTITATGDYRGWLALCAHPLTRLFLNPYELGSSEHEAEHWLLVDRHLATLDVGLAYDVQALLATQPSELHALTAELSPTEAAALLEHAFEDHAARERAKTPEQRGSDMRARYEREQELLRGLEAVLDEGMQTVIELLERHDHP